jgi:hypothetical protein
MIGSHAPALTRRQLVNSSARLEPLILGLPFPAALVHGGIPVPDIDTTTTITVAR